MSYPVDGERTVYLLPQYEMENEGEATLRQFYASCSPFGEHRAPAAYPECSTDVFVTGGRV
jgi:hypothetical protein